MVAVTEIKFQPFFNPARFLFQTFSSTNTALQIASTQPELDWQSLKKSVSERNRHMFNNSDMSNISFTCEGSDKIIYAHKYVLGTSSAVFHAMFYDDLAAKNSVINLKDTDEESFQEFLRFIYTDECNLKTDNIINICHVSFQEIHCALAH